MFHEKQLLQKKPKMKNLKFCFKIPMKSHFKRVVPKKIINNLSESNFFIKLKHLNLLRNIAHL